MNQVSAGSTLALKPKRRHQKSKTEVSMVPQKGLVSSKNFREKKDQEKFAFAFAFAQSKRALNLMNWLYVVRMNDLEHPNSDVLRYFSHKFA